MQQPHLNGRPIALLLMESENNLLDPDSLATLLLLLFIDDTKLNFSRLHRIIRNLCYHAPTREWIVTALLSIINKTNEDDQLGSYNDYTIKPTWIKLKVDAAFGYKSNIFILNKNTETEGKTEYNISINPQAAQMIAANCLEMLLILAKHFPGSFVPYQKVNIIIKTI